MPIPPLRGRFVWHELMTSDPSSAIGFYTKLVGWKTQPFEQTPGYTMFTFKGRPMGGVMALPEPSTPKMWLDYIGTPNVDETARQAESLGAKVLKKPTDIPTIGRFAIIQDPQGALFAPFTPLQGPGAPDATPGVGDFSWHELMTTDWRAALAFYKSLFGWEETESMDMGPGMGMYQMYGWKGHTLGGMMNKPAQSPAPPAWLAYTKVPDAKKAAAAIKQLGGQVINGPMQVPGGGWIAAAMDLQGVMFAVHSAKPSPKKTSRPAKATAKAARRASAAKPGKKKATKKKAPARKAKKAKTTRKTTKSRTGSKKRR